MAVSWEKILQIAPRIAMAFLPGLSAGSRISGSVARMATRSLPSEYKGMAFDYPPMNGSFYYPVVENQTSTSVEGKVAQLPSLNAGIDRGNAAAALVQDVAEHNRAVKGGYEKTLEEWWPGEDIEPRRKINPSSSAVKGIRIGEDGTVQVQWHGKNAKWYTYRAGRDLRESTRMAMELLTAPSIGRALVRKGHLAHKDSKDLTGKPVSDPNVGFWGRKYFNPSMVGGSGGMFTYAKE